MGMKNEEFINAIKEVRSEYLPKLDAVLKDAENGLSFVKSCEKWGINTSWARRIIHYGEKEFNKPNEELLRNTDYIRTWQEKFLYDLFEREDIPVCCDFDEIFEIWLSFLSESQEEVILEHYKNEKTLLDIAHEKGVTKQRISQIKLKALKRLRNPELLLIYIRGIEYYKSNKRLNSVLENGYNQGVEKNNKLSEAINSDLITRRIEQCGFNSSICFSLKELGVERVGDLLKYSYDQLYNAKGIGISKYNAIMEFLNENNLELRGDIELIVENKLQ